MNGKLLNLAKAPGMQVVSIVFSTKEGGMENVATRKRDSKEQSNLITQDERINMVRDETNEVGKSIYTT